MLQSLIIRHIPVLSNTIRQNILHKKTGIELLGLLEASYDLSFSLLYSAWLFISNSAPM